MLDRSVTHQPHAEGESADHAYPEALLLRLTKVLEGHSQGRDIVRVVLEIAHILILIITQPDFMPKMRPISAPGRPRIL